MKATHCKKKEVFDGSIPFRDYAYTWLETYKAPPTLRPSSYATTKNILENHVIAYFDKMPLESIKSIHIQRFMNSTSYLSRSVQSKCLQFIKAIFNTAVDNDLIQKSPVSSNIKVSGVPPKKQEVLTNEQAQALLNSLRNSRAYLFCLIALTTGMRRGEILGLMWEDIDLDNGFINVRHNKSFPNNANDAPVTTMLKTEAAARRIPLSDQTWSVLKYEHAASQSKFVIPMENGKSLTKGSFRALWKLVERAAGELGFDTHPHQLRHTYCTSCIEGGMEVKSVQYLMGHAKPDITLAVYAHYRQQSREAATAEQVRAVVGYLK